MQPLYPEIKPNQSDYLDTQQGHQVYYEESGSLDGIPIVFLHGGPGAGTSSVHRRYCDPEKYRMILVDQRGCGRSTPHGAIENNSTQDLINDLEAIREKLGIDRWVVMGGSWGATLALIYAESCPQRVMGLILRGVFLGRKQDIHWLYQEGTRRVYPDYWQEFVQIIPQNERADIVSAFYKRLTGQNELAKMGAAKAWAVWEARVATLEPNQALVSQFSNPHLAVAMAKISSHYFTNHCFIEENQIIQNAHQLKGIPGIIIQGRYDMLCPLENAWSLQAVWQESEIHTIRDAGHSASEPGIIDGLVRATKSMAQTIEASENQSS